MGLKGIMGDLGKDVQKQLDMCFWDKDLRTDAPWWLTLSNFTNKSRRVRIREAAQLKRK